VRNEAYRVVCLTQDYFWWFDAECLGMRSQHLTVPDLLYCSGKICLTPCDVKRGHCLASTHAAFAEIT